MDVYSFVIDYRRGNSQFSEQQARAIIAEYRKQFGRFINTRGCRTCLVDAVAELKASRKTINQTQNTMANQFKMKAGKVLQIHGHPDDLTSKNCTDEKAIALLKAFKSPEKLLVFFDSYPANWRELLAGKPKVKDPAQLSIPVDEPVADEKAETNEPPVDADAEKRKTLESKSKKQLIDICEEYDLDADEYLKLSKSALVDYLIGKL